MTIEKIGNVWYTDDAEYAVRGTTVRRGDGSRCEFDSAGEAEEAAEMLARGNAADADYDWVD